MCCFISDILYKHTTISFFHCQHRLGHIQFVDCFRYLLINWFLHYCFIFWVVSIFTLINKSILFSKLVFLYVLHISFQNRQSNKWLFNSYNYLFFYVTFHVFKFVYHHITILIVFSFSIYSRVNHILIAISSSHFPILSIKQTTHITNNTPRNP